MEKVARIGSNAPQTAKESEWEEPIRENRAEKNKKIPRQQSAKFGKEKFQEHRMA